ncbi:hypothetical protein H9Q72_006681 [Fusarium xylarioides]|uniref:Uncharacterized protein n=1 Tax=Fusarium xylarioides TaxID=221167 RepID=A0A9P7I738_9HYPO|nr:hypothetical protein H9Q72_006681 [Fusarium xylarioides]KAG5802316.1 hypothetical protein H9Q71_013096 [Fusarium xylarioides]KAG5812138.1 hypothetical protein H9Q74_013264 [Fusarium xylarioides]
MSGDLHDHDHGGQGHGDGDDAGDGHTYGTQTQTHGDGGGDGDGDFGLTAAPHLEPQVGLEWPDFQNPEVASVGEIVLSG